MKLSNYYTFVYNLPSQKHRHKIDTCVFTKVFWFQAMHKLTSLLHTQPFNGFWSGTTRVGWYQKKHTHPDHRTSFVNFLHLLRSIASSSFSLHAWQSSLTTSLQVIFGLPLGLGPSTSYSMHFLRPIIIFSQHMPIPSQPVTEVPPHFLSLQARSHFCAQLHQHLHPHSACHLGNKTYPLTPTLHWPQYPH